MPVELKYEGGFTLRTQVLKELASAWAIEMLWPPLRFKPLAPAMAEMLFAPCPIGVERIAPGAADPAVPGSPRLTRPTVAKISRPAVAPLPPTTLIVTPLARVP